MQKLILIILLIKLSFLPTLIKAENYNISNDFFINELKNHILFEPNSYNSIKNEVGYFDNIKIKLSFSKDKNCDLFYVQATYEDDYSYAKNYSKIIEVNKSTHELYFNIFQSKILIKEFGFFKFENRFKSVKKNYVKFKGILIHKKDINCVLSIESTKKKINYNFYKEIAKKNELNNNYVLDKVLLKPYLNISKNIFKNQHLKINNNSLSFDNFINSYVDTWEKAPKNKNYFKKNIIDKFNLNYVVNDLFIGDIYNEKDRNYVISCKVKKGAIKILVYNEKDEYINKLMKCSSNKIANFKLNKGDKSKIIVSSYLSDYTYKHLKFSLDLYYN